MHWRQKLGSQCASITPQAVFAECEETRNELRVNLGPRVARNGSRDSSEIRSALCGAEVRVGLRQEHYSGRFGSVHIQG
jgi:hypothetical protein